MFNLFKKKNKFRFNWNLAQRFVNDYRLPIPIMGEEMFQYHLNLYESEMGCLTNWNKLWNFIDEKFDGSPEKFLTEFYAIREKIVTEIPQSKAFKMFNTCDMDQYKTENLKPRCSSLYNETNIGKVFISFDLTKANFQALNYVDKDILLNSKEYSDFIGKFTDIYYIKESKYFRQVIFGQMNPSRHITVEKYMMRKIYDYLQTRYAEYKSLVVANSDEFVFELEPPVFEVPDTDSLEKEIKKKLGFDVHINVFTLDGYNMYSEKENHKRCTFYVKHNEIEGTPDELMCIPQPYFAIIYKLYNGLRLNGKDYHFVYENIDCIFNDNFYIKKIIPKQ